MIGKRQAEAIEETNALLDRYLQEYEAVSEGMSEHDVSALRRRQEAEVEMAVKREAEAGLLDE